MDGSFDEKDAVGVASGAVSGAFSGAVAGFFFGGNPIAVFFGVVVGGFVGDEAVSAAYDWEFDNGQSSANSAAGLSYPRKIGH